MNSDNKKTLGFLIDKNIDMKGKEFKSLIKKIFDDLWDLLSSTNQQLILKKYPKLNIINKVIS